ncbi:hypothetical protein [Enterococcus sp. AZ109]|uniref:hypothetical protein n=1 Tax=Enterococcus sp. AZ109 TaxID=2774634 RepID=UPI003F247967
MDSLTVKTFWLLAYRKRVREVSSILSLPDEVILSLINQLEEYLNCSLFIKQNEEAVSLTMKGKIFLSVINSQKVLESANNT